MNKLTLILFAIFLVGCGKQEPYGPFAAELSRKEAFNLARINAVAIKGTWSHMDSTSHSMAKSMPQFCFVVYRPNWDGLKDNKIVQFQAKENYPLLTHHVRPSPRHDSQWVTKGSSKYLHDGMLTKDKYRGTAVLIIPYDPSL